MAPCGVAEFQKEPARANEAPEKEQTAPRPPSEEWTSWKEVPRDAQYVASQGPWFVEVYSGTARLTQVMRSLGVKCLPPIDVTISPLVPDAFDVVDVEQWSFFMKLAKTGSIFFAHFGTPCNTFSAARKDDGGPPPLRSAEAPWGLADLSEENQHLVFLGNLFLLRSLEASAVIVEMGGNISIENPLRSLLWETPAFQSAVAALRLFMVDFDQCMYGAPTVKPTRLAFSHEMFTSLAVRCAHRTKHPVLKGRVWSEQFQKFVYRTKLAQEYPWRLCEQMALIIEVTQSPDCPQFARSFDLCTKDQRKRPVGQEVSHRAHRQQVTALMAQASGYQLKRGALKPLLDLETEPGVAIRWALSIPHPLVAEIAVEADMVDVIHAVARFPDRVLDFRRKQLHWWHQKALELLPVTDHLLRSVQDVPLRLLLRGVDDGSPLSLGGCCHVALYKEMLAHAQSCDQTLPELLLSGFPIVGPIARSGRWPSYTKEQPAIPVQEALSRAWEIRQRIIRRANSVRVNENLIKIWEATLEDAQEGSCLGPIFDQDDVSKVVGSTDWIPTQRFEVVQKNKVRGCDSATTNMINQITVITEKLQLPSTDSNVAALRKLRSETGDAVLAGWVLDERKAYRQVPIDPTQRKFSVICLKDPQSTKVAFFVMVGHSFGLVSAVYNYNRRSAAINEILLKLFKLVAFSFYDDKYGFEPIGTVQSAHVVAQSVHWWLGAKYDQKKLQLSRSPTILGVTYNLEQMVLEIKPDRKKDLLDEIDAILQSDYLDPGAAGKLKGKLMFGASQLWGKVGRAFLRVISERQYLTFAREGKFALEPQLREALSQWKKRIGGGPPRPIDFCVGKKADVVLFTDGFTPDPRVASQEPDRIGAVVFDRRALRPVQFTAVIPKTVKRTWLERKTQIVPVEMLAPIIALSTFADRVRARCLLCIQF